MAMHGMKKPTIKRNFFGELPLSLLSIVQEKVSSLYPKCPHAPAYVGIRQMNENAQQNRIIRTMFSLVYTLSYIPL